MATPQNVEMEAAKFLHKLIQESKDEPTKLATKLYVILQHMRSSGKENSMPYQVISRAMETVINQHGLDIEALMSSRVPLTGGTQAGDSATSQFAGSSQRIAVDQKTSLAENEMARNDAYVSSRPPVGPSGAGHDIYQGSVSHMNTKSFDHESPSSFDTRSANSQSQEMRGSPNWEKVNEKDSKRASSKRKRADSSLVTESHITNMQPLDSRNPNITNSLSRSSNLKHPEDIEVSSAHNALSLQQGGSLPLTHDVLSSRSLRNQNITGFPFEKSQVSRFSFPGGNSSAEIGMHQHSPSSLGSGAVSKIHGVAPGTLGSFAPPEPGNPTPHFSSSYDNHALVAKMHKDRSTETFSAMPLASTAGKALEHGGGIANTLANANKADQGGFPNNVTEMTMLRSAASRDTGKSPISQGPAVSSMPFKEQHLKQLRAQCLVYLAFRNGLMPKRLHLDIALGNFFPTEDGPCKELIDHKEKEHSINDPSSNPEVKMPFGRLDNARETVRTNLGSPSTGISADANLLKEPENPNTKGEKNGPASGLSEHAEEMRHLLMTRRKVEPEMLTQEITKSQTFAIKGSQSDSLNVRGFAVSNHRDDFLNRQGQDGMTDKASSVMVRSQHMKPEGIGWTGNGCYNEASKVSLSTSSVLPESVQDREENVPNQCQSLGDYDGQGSRQADGRLSSFPLTEHQKPLSGIDAEHHFVNPVKDANVLAKNVSQVMETNNEEDDIPGPSDIRPSPKYTTSEKWIMDQQKRKLLTEQNWALKQQKTQQRITACSDKFKETVSSSEDISAKTRSVIELKKLQLLELQRRLRGDILNDFFKPIAVDMDRLRSIKKHRIGRRSKQLERYEQKMKEERQKRIRERQKEFFSEIEVHKERLEDVFKMRRERWKGFNKFVREFHKRKERVHREKIDRIQREKINLLKINDVEGYLRMVQDAKSDRVKQLLKETEKYLQKLGSKLQDAKVTSRCFETDMDGNQTAGVFEKNEIAIDNEDETDQAKHYLESNEKYYLMAHSIKETVAEQPSCLVRGKLREYQMNGLRWLVSLYNNHLNGILADEMGLGKTVQVISLICYLMETKNDRGPFLVVVPSSVLPGWESEINFWAPSINTIIYSGPPEERRRLFKERIVHQKFNVLLTTYEYLMNKHDRPKLSKIQWHYVIIDEGHRIKNASCKLNADLKHYRSYHRLLLTGTPLQNNLEELWALLNFLLPNIFNSSEDFSQWFNKPFESNGDNPTDEALLSEEENLLIINRLHQVLRPFVLRRLKHKVENQLPEKIERLVRCEASAYQKLLMKRVEENLGAFGTSKVRSVHNSVMQLRNICNHPYLSQLHAEEVHDFIPKHYLPNIVRLCGKLEMLDRLLPKLKATDHRVLLFSTMTRLLDVMEDYLCWKQYRYLRLDGHTSGGDRGALIDQFNKPGSPFFIFLLSIRAGGVGVNLQAADTVIIFDTDWNPQVDLQAQARAHRIGQKKDVLVLRLETVQTVEEQVRAAAEHKLGVANQSITAGFFDNNTSAEDRREYLESLLRECKKEEAAPVLNDDALNDLIARSESEIDVFESIDKQRQEDEMEIWKKLVLEQGGDGSEPVPPLPARLVKDDDLKLFCEEMKLCEVPKPVVVSSVGLKRKGQNLGGLDTQHYGRGKRAREVRSYEEQWTEDEFEKICQVDSPESPKLKEEVKEQNLAMIATEPIMVSGETEATVPPKQFPQPSVEMPIQQSIEVTPPSKRGRGRPKKTTAEISPSPMVRPTASPSPVVLPTASPSPVVLPATSPSPIVLPATSPSPVVLPAATPPPVVLPATSPPMVLPATGGAGKIEMVSQQGTVSSSPAASGPDSIPSSPAVRSISGTVHKFGVWIAPSSQSTLPVPLVSPSSQSTPLSFVSPGSQSTTTPSPPTSMPGRGRGRKPKSGAEPPRRRGRKKSTVSPSVPDMGSQGGMVPGVQAAPTPASGSGPTTAKYVCKESGQLSHVPVLASSETAEVNMVSERVLVSSPPTVPGSSIAAQSIGVGTAPSSQPTPPSPSVTIGSQSIGVGVAAIPQPAPPLSSIAPGSQTISATTAPNSQPAPTPSSAALGPQSIGAGTAPSSQPTLPSPSVGLGSQSLDMGTAPSSQLTPPFPSVPPGFQPIPPSQPIPKQGRGRGRKAQTGVAAPRRGRKRKDAATTVAPDGSVGRNAIATRSKRQNEAQILMNVVQVQETSSSVPMDASKSSDKNPANLNVNEVDVSTNSKDGVLWTETEAPKSCSDPATGQTQSADVPPVIKEVPCNTHSLETKVEEPLKSELVPLPASDNTCAEVTVTQNLDNKTHSAPSNLGTDPVHDLPIDKGESQPVKEVGEMIEMLTSNVRDEFVAPKPDVRKPESERTASVSIAPISDAKQFDESLSKDDDSGPTRPMSTATVVDVNEEQSLKVQICSDKVGPVFDLSKDRSENEQGTVDVQEQENKDNVLSETLVSEPAANPSLEVKAILTLETLERETPALELPVDKTEDEFQKEVASEQETENLVMDEAIASNLDVIVNQSSLETSSSVSSTFVEPPPGFKRPMYMPEGPTRGDVKQQDSKDEPVQANSVVLKPEVTVTSLEYAAAPIVEEDTDEQESKGSVAPNPEVIASSSEANAFSASTYETPMVVEDSGDPILANSVTSNSEVPENSSEEKELSTSTLEENEAVVETAMKQSEDESMKMDIDEQESLEPALVSKPDEVCLEEKTSSDVSVTETAEPLVEPQTEKPENISEENALLTSTLEETAVPIVEPALKESEDQYETAEPLVEPQTENPENNSEENAISTSALEETAAPIVEPALKESEDQSEKMETDEQESIDPTLVSKPGEVCLEEKTSSSLPVSETAELLVEPQTENPENISEENTISTSTLEETAAPIVEPDLKESEDQLEKMETDEQESINPDLVSKPGEVCVEKMWQTENPENISKGNTISTSTLEETATPIVEPDLKESEDQLEKMETDEQESVNPDLVSKPGEVCVEEKTSSSLPVSEIAEPLVEPQAENPENDLEENTILNSTLEETAAPIVEPALKESEDQSEKMETNEHESINPDLVSKPGEVCLEEKTSSSLPVSETAELLVEPQTENPENISEENTILTSNLEETTAPIVEPDLKESEDQSAKMDTDEQESIDPGFVSKAGVVCLEERTSSSLPVSETAEPFVEPETEKPEIHTEKELEAEGTGSKDFDPNGASQEVYEPDINPNPAGASNEKITDSGKPVEEDSETKINEEEGSSSAPDNTGTEEKENVQCEMPPALDSSLEDPADNDKPVPPQDN